MLTPPRAQLRFLGGFRAEMEAARTQALRITARKGRALLAYLATRPDWRDSRERLANLLWGDRVDTQARHNLRQCLVVLRRDLQPVGAEALTIEGEEVALNRDLFSVDVLDFALLAESADAADLERAVELYRGEFLAGLVLDVEPFDEWVRLERGRLASLAAHAFARAAEKADAAGDGVRAIATAERLIGFDPLREEAQRLLLRLYARHRGRDAALVQAETFAATLRNELDVEPEAETAQLIEHIRLGNIPSTSGVVQQRSGMPIKTATDHEVADAPGALEPKSTLQMGRESWMPHAWRGLPAAAFVIAAAIGVLILSLPSVTPDKGSHEALGRHQTRRASEAVVAVDQSWRSPSIYRGAAVDGAALASEHRQALVVLPFAVDDPADGTIKAFARQITVDLINDLARAPTIRVISARTSQLYGGQPIDVAAIGAELGVHYVVEGSVRRQESHISVYVALTDAKTRLTAWSDRFERALNERFAVRDEIVKGIARRLHVAVIIEEDRQRRGDPGNAGELLAKGWAAIFRMNDTGGPRDAKMYFEHVLRTRPDSPSALTGLAAYHVLTLAFEVVPDRKARIDLAEELLTRALQKKPRSSAAHFYLGLARKARGDLAGALESFAKAIEINPSHAPAYANAGHMLVRMGRFDDGLDHVRYAIRLSPKDPVLAGWQMFGGEGEIARGNDDAAIEWLTRAVTLSPRRPFARALLGAAYALKGDAAAAAQQIPEWKKLAPGIPSEALLGTLGKDTHLSARLVKGLRLAIDHSS